MTQKSSWFIRRLERGVAKRLKKLEKLRAKVAKLEAKHAAGKITRAKLEMKRKDIETQARVVQARISTFRGTLGKERRKLEKGDEEA